MIVFKHKGDLKKTSRFLERNRHLTLPDLDVFGQQGVNALSAATPKDTGVTADSWYYQIVRTDKNISIQWLNRNVVDGVPIAVILQYGHGTGTGGYVQGRDYINPAIRPIFDKIAENAWKEVIK